MSSMMSVIRIMKCFNGKSDPPTVAMGRPRKGHSWQGNDGTSSPSTTLRDPVLAFLIIRHGLPFQSLTCCNTESGIKQCLFSRPLTQIFPLVHSASLSFLIDSSPHTPASSLPRNSRKLQESHIIHHFFQVLKIPQPILHDEARLFPRRRSGSCISGLCNG